MRFSLYWNNMVYGKFPEALPKIVSPTFEPIVFKLDVLLSKGVYSILDTEILKKTTISYLQRKLSNVCRFLEDLYILEASLH